MTRRKTAFCIFLASICLFIAGLYSAEFIRINCRFGLFVHEMAENPMGPFPLLYGEPYCDYLSIHAYLMYLASFLGGVNMLTATLPSALAAGGVMTLTYLIGARKSNKFGLYAVIMLAASYEFLCIARAPSPDMFVAFAAICSFYLMYTAELENKAARLFLLPVLFVLGFIMRGPIGTVIPVAVVFIYYISAYRWKTAVAAGVLGTLVMACCMMLLIMMIYEYGGKELIKTFQNIQIGSRMSKGKPFWFYFTNAMGSYALSYPLAFFVMGTYGWIERKKYFSRKSANSYSALRLRLTGWLLIIILGMSIPGTKHLRYVVSALPAAALLSAFLFVNPDDLPIFRKIRDLFLKICTIVPFVAVAVVAIGAIVLKILDLDIPVPMFLPSILFLILGFAMFNGMRKVKVLDRGIFIAALTVMTFFIIKIMLIEPIENYAESSYKFVKEIEDNRLPGTKVAFCGIDRDGEALKYLINLKPRSKFYIPIFVGLCENDELLDLPAGNLVVFKEGKTKFIKPEVGERLEEISRGDLGHRECILYRLKDKK